MTSASDPDPATIAGAPAGTGPYNLLRPTLEDARSALRRLYGARADDLWRQLLSRAGLTGSETDQVSFHKIVDVMAAADPVTSLCARALTIRALAYHHLSTAQHLIRDAEQAPTRPQPANPPHAEEHP